MIFAIVTILVVAGLLLYTSWDLADMTVGFGFNLAAWILLFVAGYLTASV